MAPSILTAFTGVLSLVNLANAAAVALEPRQAATSCAPVPSPSKYPTWSQLPVQTTLPDPFLPLAYTTNDNAGGSSSFAQDVMTGKGKNRIQTPEEWYRCRQPEIVQMLQEYQYVFPSSPLPSPLFLSLFTFAKRVHNLSFSFSSRRSELSFAKCLPLTHTEL
jgi:hypothetical protein